MFCPRLLPIAAGLEQPRSTPPHPPTWNSGGRFVRNQGCCCTACRLMRCWGSCGQQAGADQPQVGYRHGTLLRCRLLPHANRPHACCSARSRAPGTHVIATARPCAPHMNKDPADHLHTAVGEAQLLVRQGVAHLRDALQDRQSKGVWGMRAVKRAHLCSRLCQVTSC